MKNWTSKNRLTDPRGLTHLASIVLAIAMLPSLAVAIPSYTFDIEPGDMQNNFNVPRFTLSNTSTGGEEILGFSISIGDDENFFYDFVADMNSNPAGLSAHVATEATTGARLVIGDRMNDRAGTSRLLWEFDDFQADESLVFQADIDPLSAQTGGHQSTDSRYAFLNNGDADNAVLNVVFSNGAVAHHVFEDIAGALPNHLQFSGLGQMPEGVIGGPPTDNHFPQGPPTVSAPVPEPGAALLFSFGLLTVAAKRPRASNSAHSQ